MPHIVPFVPGWRPTDEAVHPTLGSSEATALITGDADNRAYVLYELDAPAPVAVSLALGDGTPVWTRRPLAPRAFVPGPALRPAAPGSGCRLVLELAPERDLPAEAFGFADLFSQRLRVELHADGGSAATALDVCDARRCGTLYQRLVDRLVAPDAACQGAALAEHPWYPALAIGREKAALYTRALVRDIVHKRRHLTDPGWLLRVGLYLEFLTFLGICAAVGDETLLSADERAALAHGTRFAELRARIDPAAWREVWALRDVRRGARNLLAKKHATLAFLHAHHRDLQHAIELAGPNEHNAQETWQRVFRDAERAVVEKTPDAFPELAQLPEPAREIVREGLYATACRQYRASMNGVAAWGRERGLMDYTGGECIPASASLFGARAEALERCDGAGGAAPVALETVAGLLAAVPLFAPLEPAQLRELAAGARPLALGPSERLVVQGQPGESLFVVADGLLEVVVRRGRADAAVDVLAPGEVAGEMSLLTGEPRCATLRCLDEALVYEISRRQFAALARAHPEWLDALAALMAARLAGRRRRVRRRIRRFLYSQGAVPGGPRISIPKRAAVAAITAGSGGSGSGGSVRAPAG